MHIFEGNIRKIGIWMDDERLPHALLEVGPEIATVQGQGTLREAIVVEPNGTKHEVLSGAVVSLSGCIRHDQVDLDATLVVRGKFISGRIEHAIAKGVTFEVSAFDSLRAKESTSEMAPGSPSSEIEQADSVGWADVASASAIQTKNDIVEEAEITWAKAASVSTTPAFSPKKKKRAKRIHEQVSTVPLPPKQTIPKAAERPKKDAFYEEQIPEEGDYIKHRQLGLCLVIDPDDGEGSMIVKLEDGRRKRVVLDVFHVLEPLIEDDRIIYPLQPKKKA